VVRPDIGGLLPVYVYDEYEGFAVKTFVDLTTEELSTYTEANIEALVRAIDAHDPEAIVTGHEVMGPYIAHIACGRDREYVAKLHGSALEYAVKVQERYRRFAIEGLGGATAVVGGSRYMVEEASRTIPGWRDRATVVNPGCDVDLFRPVAREPHPIPRVGFVGKLIAAKGVHHLLAAAGLLETKAEIAIVGYGGFEGELREIAGALSDGDIERALEVVARSDDGYVEAFRSFLKAMKDDPSYRSRAGEVRVDLLGRLDHEDLAPVLPTFDVLVVPSILPEAFGMVAAEAAACGVLPLVPDHSGIGEVGRTLESELGAEGLLTFDPTDPVRGIAAGLDRILGLDGGEREQLGRKASAFARSRWSWTVVAERLLEVATVH
jgi:glycosyltransferase involved in cell wall biosynthesis